jgi:uncharacterized membrane protein
MTDGQGRQPGSIGPLAVSAQATRRIAKAIRRAFAEFLAIPTAVISFFLLLALVMYVIDAGRAAHDGPRSENLWGGLFNDLQATREFLGVIAGSIITVTSITLSLLLIAVQQGASALTSLVFDQFLRRRTNQIYFGAFIGLALYSLLVLASIKPSHHPVYSVALAGLLTVAALYMLIVLIYTTIDQSRPVVIITAIHDHTHAARARQFGFVRSTRRVPRLRGPAGARVVADRGGFVTRIDAAGIAEAAPGGETEITILVSIGDYVATGDPIAEIRTIGGADTASLRPKVQAAFVLDSQRDLDTDPAFGIDQIMTIGWTSISTAKSNPGPGLLAIQNLSDLLACWLRTDEEFGAPGVAEPSTPVVYVDNLPTVLMRAFETLAVVASEAMQPQTAAEIYRTLARLLPRLPDTLRRQADDLVLRSLSGLGDHVLTSELEASLAAMRDALRAAGRPGSADAVAAALHGLGRSIGRLNSRSTRAGAGGERLYPGG